MVIVPGLRDHVAEHWQTLLADRLPNTRTVEPLHHDKHSLPARVAALDAVVADTTGPVILVAHSAGVMITVAWAQRHNTRNIAGALLATPPDLTVALPAGYPTPEQLRDNGWYPTPRNRLRFPSHRRRQHQRPTVPIRPRRDPRTALGRPPRRRRPGRTPQPRRRLRILARRRGSRPRTRPGTTTPTRPRPGLTPPHPIMEQPSIEAFHPGPVFPFSGPR